MRDLEPDHSSNRDGHIMQTVLVTGAAGGIGTRLRQLLKGVYPNIRLSDVKRPADLAADETFVEADTRAASEPLAMGRHLQPQDQALV